jgi:hypothetical protein
VGEVGVSGGLARVFDFLAGQMPNTGAWTVGSVSSALPYLART